MNNELNELKPCPFCGGKAEEDTHIGGVICENYCTNPNTFDGGGGVWTADWNTRPIEDALNARIAKLVNLVEVQHDDNCHLADMCRQRDASIAELEATIDQLIAAGESLTRVAEWRYANLTELLAWDTLVEKIHKEREK